LIPRDHGAVSFGVYVHVPFCAHRCDYCDFATWTDRAHLIDAYVDACVRDLHRHAAEGVDAATTVFFGGGTPSLLPAGQLARILGAIDRSPDAEVTVECNPDSVDATKLATYVAAGVNRVSFGVQSLVPHVLQALGRTHDPDNVRRAIAMAREAGIERINVDLIYGAAEESADDWRRTVEGALELDVEHISAYALTVEPATALGRMVAAGTRRAPDDDRQADAYVTADDAFNAAGYKWYEISNWARPGEACRHNLLYWRGGDYLGIGCAAHGYTGGRRWWNVRTPDRYIEAIADNRSPEAGSEILDDKGRAEESFALALRTRAGARVGADAAHCVDDLVDAALCERDDDRVVLTRTGRLLASDVTARLLLAGAHLGRRQDGLALDSIEC
jgi:oxygen-independent coproporphyrinogen-3 oxidase